MNAPQGPRFLANPLLSLGLSALSLLAVGYAVVTRPAGPRPATSAVAAEGSAPVLAIRELARHLDALVRAGDDGDWNDARLQAEATRRCLDAAIARHPALPEAGHRSLADGLGILERLLRDAPPPPPDAFRAARAALLDTCAVCHRETGAPRLEPLASISSAARPPVR